MSNPAFAADALAGFNSIPATGPYTLSGSSSAVFLSLPNVTSAYQTIISNIRSQAASDSVASSFLPLDYRTSPSMIRGYKRQLSLLADLLSNPQSPSIEVPFSTGTVFKAIHLHPLSRGTVRIDLSSPLSEAILDYRTGSNPVDFDIYLAHMEYMRKLVNTTTFQQRGAVEIAPGPAATDLLEAVKDSLTFSFMHPCCTAAMMPEDLGGVVGTDLKVHGTEGLRVVDMSVLPFLPGGHLSATAYAVGEKVSDFFFLFFLFFFFCVAVVFLFWSRSCASASLGGPLSRHQPFPFPVFFLSFSFFLFFFRLLVFCHRRAIRN